MTAEQIAAVLGKVKALLRLEDNLSDGLLTIHIEEMGQRILDYCNLCKMPDGLILVWAKMAADLVKLEEAGNEGIFGEGAVSNSSVKSISEGDTSLSLGADSGSTAAAISGVKGSYVDTVLHNYLPSLHKWRRMRS